LRDEGKREGGGMPVPLTVKGGGLSISMTAGMAKKTKTNLLVGKREGKKTS